MSKENTPTMKDRTQRKVLPFKRPFPVNIGLMIFLIILVYILMSVFFYFRSGRTEVYEVRQGSLTTNTMYTGIALREETVVVSDYDGRVNYYNKEGERIPVGSLLYTVDENDVLRNLILEEEQEDAYTDSELQSFRDEAIKFAASFDPAAFSSVYDFRSTAVSTVLKLTGREVLDSIDDPEEEGIHLCRAEETGEVIYSTDGYESCTFDEISGEHFSGTDYSKHILSNGEPVREGDPVCKIITNVTWSIVIRTSAEEAEMLEQEQYIRVRFLKNGNVSWAQTQARSDGEGNYYVNLKFNNSMEAFSADRFVEIELLMDEQSGLKVPNSAITKGKFFLIPKEFVQQGLRSQYGVLLETYTENNEKSVQFVPTPPYGETDDKYYVDDSILRAGEIIDKPNSSEQFEIGEQVELIGVYYINRGYPDFRQVNILYQNEEYAIVSPSSYNGLQEFDYIVLHAGSIRLGE